MIWPARGRISSEFGRRARRQHRGIDISSKRGSPIYAVEEGKVSFVGRKRGYGKTVVIRHASYETLYAHCASFAVQKGQWVRQGQVVAAMGATGNATGVHLHFEWRTLKGLAQNPRGLLQTAATARLHADI